MLNYNALNKEVRVTDRSLRFTTVRLFGDMQTAATQYIRGLNTRSESRSCRGISDTKPPTNVRYEYGPLRAYILNRDLGYRFEVEPATHAYTAFRVNEHGSPAWAKPRKYEPAKRSGKTIHHYIDTIDTGERRELFGYTARRVVTRTRQMQDSQMLSESECDGWYIDPPAAWANLHPPPKVGTFDHATVGTGARDDHKFTETGKRETGFTLLATRTDRSSLKEETGNLRTHEGVAREEVAEFSEAPLEPDLFVPPHDFKRVPQLSDGVPYALPHRLRLRWEILKDSLSLPNTIANFTA
jgi:hypothetical protein